MSEMIIANWKMHGDKEHALRFPALLEEALPSGALEKVTVVVCPQALHIPLLLQATKGSAIAVGGQDCHREVAGAHTGDVSAHALRDAGCTYVIVGHSERRTHHNESNKEVYAKAKAALVAGLTPIICIGESLIEREAGRVEAVLCTQLQESMPEEATPDNSIIAYEPIWAIGTGVTATIEQIVATHKVIKEISKQLLNGFAKPYRVVYGGSVKPGNAGDILACDGVDGVLVGGASVEAASFAQIITASLSDALAIVAK